MKIIKTQSYMKKEAQWKPHGSALSGGAWREERASRPKRRKIPTNHIEWTLPHDSKWGEQDVVVEYHSTPDSPETGRYGPPENYDPGGEGQIDFESVKLNGVDILKEVEMEAPQFLEEVKQQIQESGPTDDRGYDDSMNPRERRDDLDQRFASKKTAITTQSYMKKKAQWEQHKNLPFDQNQLADNEAVDPVQAFRKEISEWFYEKGSLNVDTNDTLATPEEPVLILAHEEGEWYVYDIAPVNIKMELDMGTHFTEEEMAKVLQVSPKDIGIVKTNVSGGEEDEGGQWHSFDAEASIWVLGITPTMGTMVDVWVEVNIL